MGDVPPEPCKVLLWFNGQTPGTLPLRGHIGFVRHEQGPLDIREGHLSLLQLRLVKHCNDLFLNAKPGLAWCQPRPNPALPQPAPPMRAAAPARGKPLHAQDEAFMASL